MFNLDFFIPIILNTSHHNSNDLLIVLLNGVKAHLNEVKREKKKERKKQAVKGA